MRVLKNDGLSREEVQDKVFEVYETELSSMDHLGERLTMLRKGGLGNIFDYLEEHPSGPLEQPDGPGVAAHVSRTPLISDLFTKQ